ncbi:MAG: PQQ-dependent sugar dehydrogenase [Planctomycetes bacterium]|nr:PQQ-dependent sugar dehydrogenase [Planctomycetota bacterium]
MRQTALFGLALGALFVSAPAASAQAPITSVRVANGLTRPVYVTAPVGDTARLFIVEQRIGSVGQVRILNLPGHTLNATPYLSITPVNTGNEEGLLGLAFHPDFANNGYLFAYFTNTSGNNQVMRYQANLPYMTSTTAVGTGTPVITFSHPTNSNHNGGWIGFGPDGYLYIGTGDGGSANDPPGNGQNINSLLGKMLRIDVNSDDFPGDTTRNYAIPPTNPFAGATPGLDEIWHYGIRNPWRNSFDRLTGDMWIGDVGQNAWEEIDFAPAGVGGLNYGWRCMEGNACTGLSGCTCSAPALTAPVTVYSHAGGACSVTGGYRYRGTQLCGWDGVYFFADYCNAQISSFTFNGSVISNLTNRTAQLAPGGGLSIATITSFGEDAAGELYICDQGGEVFKVIQGAITDCNNNGIHDSCDIANMTSMDTNNDGIPDECQPSITPVCFGDGTGTACPCANGAAGRGCANSVNASGGLLGMTGVASVVNDSLVLNGSGMPDGPVLYFQGTSVAGTGIVLGDGLFCATGSIIRLVVKFNSGGASSYPNFIETPLSFLGGLTTVPLPTTRVYQAWYRDGDPLFCTPSNFNLTNAVSVVWVN